MTRKCHVRFGERCCEDRHLQGCTASRTDSIIETQTAEQLADVMVDDGEAWSKTLTVTAGTFAHVEASMDGRASSDTTIRCENEVEGEVLKSAEAEGPWANVLCSGTVGR